MKKLISSILTLAMVFAMAACGNENAAGTQQDSATDNTTIESQTTTETGREAEMQTENSEETSTQAGEETNSEPEETAIAGSSAVVVYFSWSGNTRSIANEIQAQTGADIFELVPATPYSDDYNTVLDEARTEQSAQARPEITGTIENFDSYDVVYVGFPNWWGDMPMILYSFFDDYDLSGKTIVPFVSSGGSGFSGTLNTMRGLEPDAEVLEGLSLGSSASANPQDAVKEWLDGLDLGE